MPRTSPSLLTRLRRHRGLWVLAMTVLMIKLVAGTVCLTDDPGKRAVVQTTIAILAENAAAGEAAAGDLGGCLLGEAGDCHCACAHTMPLPATAPLSIARVDTHFDRRPIHAGFAPASIGSLLRPPIV